MILPQGVAGNLIFNAGSEEHEPGNTTVGQSSHERLAPIHPPVVLG